MDRYFEEWDENTRIDWWNHGRKQLNVIIRLVNGWTLDGAPDEGAALLLRHIDKGLQTFAKDDERAEWGDVLREMQRYVKERTEGS